MADYYGADPYQRFRSYFPNVNPGTGNAGFPLAPGVAEGEARIKQLQKQGRPKLSTFTLPGGAQVRLPAGSRLPSGYSQIEGQPSGVISAPRYSDTDVATSAMTPAPYTNYSQDYAKGFGQPVYPSRTSPSLSNAIGPATGLFANVFGPYLSATGNATAALGRFVQPLLQGAGNAAANTFQGFRNAFMPNPMQAIQNYQQTGSFSRQPTIAATQPRDYFHPDYNY